MRPGDVVTCAACGARARATFSSGAAAWREGYPVALTWTHGPHPRCHVVTEAPALCSWCFERRQALGDDAEPLYRPAPGAELELPPAEPAGPPGQTYVEDLATGQVSPFTPPTQLGLL